MSVRECRSQGRDRQACGDAIFLSLMDGVSQTGGMSAAISYPTFAFVLVVEAMGWRIR